MAKIHDLLERVGDANLRSALKDEFERATKHKKFGLVFEQHLPEAVSLYGFPIKVGSRVATKVQDGGALFIVKEIKGKKAECIPIHGGEAITFNLDELVAVALCGEPVFPILTAIDEVQNAPDSSLWHTLIQADNYHALQLLEYLYPGKVDCIYIDPPYNKPDSHDWKYNNDYVDGNDAWCHSKWLSMMEKRLALAKKLLNPKDSVLIVTIDESEYLALGMLLQQMFREARIEMITSVISAKGVVRAGQFSRVEEYVYVVTLGAASVSGQERNMLDNDVKKEADREIEWLGYRRRAPQATRLSRPHQFHPVFVNKSTGLIELIGDDIAHGIDRNSVPVPRGCVALWPLSKEKKERLWSLCSDVARENWKKGYIRVNWNARKQEGTVYYLPEGTIADIESGKATIKGRNSDGSVSAVYSQEGVTPPKRVWNMRSHNAETYGTNLIQSIIGNRFTYPKSLYAVHDTIRFFVANKPNALILDFFAGSGTTMHAVNMLNAEDGGKRRCIMVTNNEMSESEMAAFRAKGLKPGDEKWEKHGIAQYVTWPRTKCSILGENVKGEKLEGNYGVEVDDYVVDDEAKVISKVSGKPLKRKLYKQAKRQLYPALAAMRMADGFKANAKFFKLDFADRDSVRFGQQFKGILPILWMRAGAKGRCPEWSRRGEPAKLVCSENGFAVLVDQSLYRDFIHEVNADKAIKDVYFVTDDEMDYQTMCEEVVRGKRTFQLYHNYIESFVIGARRS